jgi:hypothetical protein
MGQDYVIGDCNTPQFRPRLYGRDGRFLGRPESDGPGDVTLDFVRYRIPRGCVVVSSDCYEIKIETYYPTNRALRAAKTAADKLGEKHAANLFALCAHGKRGCQTQTSRSVSGLF